MYLLKRSLFALAVLLFASSCVKDEVEVNDLNYGVSPEFGVPIALANISAQQVIDNIEGDDIIQTAEDGAVSLVFIDTLEKFRAVELLNLQDQSYGFEMDLTPAEYAILFGEGSYTATQEQVFSFVTQEGDRLDSVRFESGVFGLNINTESNIPISGTVRVFDNMDQEVYSMDFEDTSPPISIAQEEDFENIKMAFINDTEFTNGLRIQYEVTFEVEGGSGVTGPLNIDLSLSNYEVESAGGFIASRTSALNDIDVNVDLFDDSFVGNLVFADPRLNLHFENSFGIDLGFQIDELYGINTEMDLFSVLEDGFEDFPIIEGASFPGETVSSTISISNQNMTPSLTEFMAFEPEYISGFFSGLINPEEENLSFITADSELGIVMEAVLPIYGSVDDFYLNDTAEVNLGSIVSDANEVGELEKADIRLIVDNGLPVDAGVQIVFTDSLFQPLDSLFADDTFVFNSAPVNTSVATDDPNHGRATGKTKTITDIEIPKDRLNDLENATNILIRVYGATTNGGDQNIRLFSEDEIDISLAAKLSLNFDE